MFNITDKVQDERIILLQFNSEIFEIAEYKSDEADVEYMFLTKTLGRREGLNKETTPTLYANMNNITKLVKYLFLTEQMGWRKGITLFGETKKETVEEKLHQIHDME